MTAWNRFFRKTYTCTCGRPYFTCGRPAVACVKLFGWNETNVCAWHLEPLEDASNPWIALNFLARMWREVPA